MSKYYETCHNVSGLKVGDRVVIIDKDIDSTTYTDITIDQIELWNRQKLNLLWKIGVIKADNKRKGFTVWVDAHHSNTHSIVELPHYCLKKLCGSKYYMVHNTLGNSPTKMHFDINIAIAEAKRLASANVGKSFAVLGAILSFKVETPEPTETILK